MSEAELMAELKSVKRRLAELEAANGLRQLAPSSEDEQLLAEASALAGVGVRSVQGQGQDADTVRRRRIVATILRRRMGWTVPRIARAMRKTVRTVARML